MNETATLGVLFIALSMAWPVAILIFTDRVIWFGSGSLALTHWTAALVLVAPLISPKPEPRRRWAYLTLAVASLSLVPWALYLANVICGIVAPDLPAATLVRTLAGVLWATEREFTILGLILLAVTLVATLWTILLFARRLCRGGDKVEEEPDSDEDT